LGEKDHIPLNQFQEWMQQLLLDPFQKTSTNPHSLLPESYKNASLGDVVNRSKKLSAQGHMAIYQRSYIARLRHCMVQQFSALEYALGEDIFCALADDYLASRPSQHYNLALLGEHFAAHLQANRPDENAVKKEDWIDFMIELARFEYTLGLIFEEDAEEKYQLAELNDSEENLKLVPICYLFHFQFPIRWFYTEFKNGNKPDLPFEQESYCLVLRPNYKLAIYDLKKEQFEFLTSLKNGNNIEDAKAAFKLKHLAYVQDFERVWPIWKEFWIEANVFRV
jgi:Putative DNA-binding domain